MSNTFTINNGSYDLLQCCICGVNFLIPTIVNKRAWEKRGQEFGLRQNFFCPNGHALGYDQPKEKEKNIEQKREGNIINFFKKDKKDDGHKLDPKPAC
jgi:hypothetical protein